MRKFLLVFLCLLIPGTSAYGDSILLSSEALFSEMVSCSGNEGEVGFQLSVWNKTQRAMDVCLFEPLFNGYPASFGTGQTSLKIQLQSEEQMTACAVICSDDPSETPENVSFRYCFQENITSRAVICAADRSCVPAQAFPEEGQAVLSDVQTPYPSARNKPQPLTDRFDAADISLLDYAQALVCLQEGESLRLLTVLPASVDPDGQACAVFSNLLLAVDGASPFLLSTAERSEKGTILWTSDRISLYGESVYFAGLSLAVSMTQESARVIRQSLDAEEFGTAVHAPYALFDEGTASCLQYRIKEEDGTKIPVVSNAVFQPLTISEPLRLLLLPAGEQGQLVYFFEYYLTNGESIVHPLITLDAIV